MRRPPVIHVIGWSGAGKTTVLAALIRALTREGVRVGTIKHHHARGRAAREPSSRKDTGRHAAAGARLTALSGTDGAVVRVLGEVTLAGLIALLAPHADLILVEGYTAQARLAISILDSCDRERPPSTRCRVLARVALTPRGRVPRATLAAAVAAVRARLAM